MDSNFKEAVKALCTCGKIVSVGYGTDPEGNKNVPCVLHPMPPCQKYTELDVNDYLEYIRKAREN